MPGFALDNQNLLYIIIALFVVLIVQLFVMRWYVNASIEDAQHKNNKKIVKRVTDQIGSTFDRYMGGGNSKHPSQSRQDTQNGVQRVRRNKYRDMDSIDDPADDVDEQPQEEEYQQDDETCDRD